jgi:hypothetical protein
MFSPSSPTSAITAAVEASWSFLESSARHLVAVKVVAATAITTLDVNNVLMGTPSGKKLGLS